MTGGNCRAEKGEHLALYLRSLVFTTTKICFINLVLFLPNSYLKLKSWRNFHCHLVFLSKVEELVCYLICFLSLKVTLPTLLWTFKFKEYNLPFLKVLSDSSFMIGKIAVFFSFCLVSLTFDNFLPCSGLFFSSNPQLSSTYIQCT